MKKVKCKQCDCDIFHDYEKSSIGPLNTPWKFPWFRKKEPEKYMSELRQSPTITCCTLIRLTCENNHTDNYFCKIIEDAGRFNTVDEAELFLKENNIPGMTGAEMIKKMSKDQIIKFAEFLYYM